MFSSRGKFITLTGPGIVYIDMQVGSRFFKKDQISLYVVVLYFLLYFMMFLIVSFDRRLERIVAAAAGGNAQWLKIKFNLKSLTNEINNGLIFQCDGLFEFWWTIFRHYLI